MDIHTDIMIVVPIHPKTLRAIRVFIDDVKNLFGVLYQVFSIDFLDKHQNVIRGYVGAFIVNVCYFIEFTMTQDFSCIRQNDYE